MWLFIKSLFMVKDRCIAKEMVESELSKNQQLSHRTPNFKLNRLLRRRWRRSDFKAHNTTHLKFKVK